MSRKHNTKHRRARGGYKRRLDARGFTHSPRMTDLATLRKRANAGPVVIKLPQVSEREWDDVA